MTRSSRTIVLVLTALVLVTAPFTNAQQVFGRIFGTVVDASGAAVVNAKVTITDVNKATTFEVTTDQAGNYSRGQLIPDPYKITIEAQGFQKVVSDNLEVHVDESVRYDAALKVGDAQADAEMADYKASQNIWKSIFDAANLASRVYGYSQRGNRGQSTPTSPFTAYD